MQSRSSLERLTALVLAGGVVLSSSFGSPRGSHSGHHPVGSAHPAEHAALAYAGGTGTSAAHDSSERGHPSDSSSAPEECPCAGGVCVVSVQAGPTDRHADTLLDWSAPATAAFLFDIAVPAGSSDRYLQPPGRAPPAV